MRLGRQSSNIEDRRGMGPGMGGFGMGGGSGMRVPIGGLGIGGLLLVLVLGYCVTGSPLGLFGGDTVPVDTGAPASTGAPSDAEGQFVSRVLADTEDTWDQVFAQAGRQYQRPTLVLFSDEVGSACGMSSAAVGPFYCPRDAKVYIDLSFYRDLDRQFGAPGDFAQAYVIAHEVGHHVQNLLGVFERVQRSGRNDNATSVAQELQEDCYAGVWGHYAAQRGVLDPGDVEEGLTAAAAIGDDRIQRQTQGRVTPETWTHGSSAQRVRWFRAGLDSGRVQSCDTFATGGR